MFWFCFVLGLSAVLQVNSVVFVVIGNLDVALCLVVFICLVCSGCCRVYVVCFVFLAFAFAVLLVGFV